MYGMMNDKETQKRSVDDKEDYEMSIRHYIKDGGVLRFNCVTIQTNYYTEPGGMQTVRTEKRITDSAIYLRKQYPALCELNCMKRSGHLELRLKDIRKESK